MVATTGDSKVNSALLGAVQKKVSEIHSSFVPEYLPPIKVINVREIKIDTGMALVVFISANMLKKLASSAIKSILEKSYQKPVFIIGNRKIIPKAAKRSEFNKVKRPYHCTLTAVHEAILEDLVAPSDIFGQRTIHKADGTVVRKVYLDPSLHLENQFSNFRSVYKELCNKDVYFENPLHDCPMRRLKVGGGKRRR